jgi:hypothetical protein
VVLCWLPVIAPETRFNRDIDGHDGAKTAEHKKRLLAAKAE